MAYTPDPTDASQPVETQFASTAAAEFRALKAYIQTLTPILGLKGRLLNIQVFNVAGNAVYIPTVGTNFQLAAAVGGGGGGGGAAATAAGEVAVGGGGQGGTAALVLWTTNIGQQNVTVGAGGVGGVGAGAGAFGTATTIGTLLSCPGGGPGQSLGAFPPIQIAAPGSARDFPTLSSGSLLLGSPQSSGQFGHAPTLGSGGGGPGGTGLFGAAGGVTAFANNGFEPFGGGGAGGGGAHNSPSLPVRTGGRGGDGRIIFFEFS